MTLTVGDTARSVTIEDLDLADEAAAIEACRGVISDPEYWFRVGWSRYGGAYPRSPDRTIPGSDPVVEVFPQLQSPTPAGSSSVDMAHLESITEPGRYERGQRYSRTGAVTAIDRVDDWIQATVQGSRPYDVRVRMADGQFVEGQCSCPDDAIPCKHIVAVVLASGDVEPVGTDRSLDAVLEAASADEVRALLESIAKEDLDVRRRIYAELGE